MTSTNASLLRTNCNAQTLLAFYCHCAQCYDKKECFTCWPNATAAHQLQRTNASALLSLFLEYSATTRTSASPAGLAMAEREGAAIQCTTTSAWWWASMGRSRWVWLSVCLWFWCTYCRVGAEWNLVCRCENLSAWGWASMGRSRWVWLFVCLWLWCTYRRVGAEWNLVCRCENLSAWWWASIGRSRWVWLSVCLWLWCTYCRVGPGVQICRVGQNRICTPYMYTVYLVVSLPTILYMHRIYKFMVLFNPTKMRT
jgi:hypothetical protein